MPTPIYTIPSYQEIIGIIPSASAPGQTGTFIPDYATILSVWPISLRHSATIGGRFLFELPAAVPEKVINHYASHKWLLSPSIRPQSDDPAHLQKVRASGEDELAWVSYTIPDTYDLILDSIGGPIGSRTQVPVRAESFSQAMVQDWKTSVKGMVRVAQVPGAMGIGIYNPSRPVKDQVKELWHSQTLLANAAVDEANNFHYTNDGSRIAQSHRALARWAGKTNLECPWLAPVVSRPTKECGACRRVIFADALVCEHCTTNLINFYIMMAANPQVFAVLPTDFAVKTALGALYGKPQPAKERAA